MNERKIPLDEYGSPDVEYDDLVREAVGPWVGKATFGGYQGDYVYLFRDGGRVGYLVVGFGSCSGCDWLENVIGYSLWDRMSADQQAKVRSGLDEMVATFRRDLRWFDTDDELTAHLHDGDGKYWYLHEADFDQAMRRLLAGGGSEDPGRDPG